MKHINFVATLSITLCLTACGETNQDKMAKDKAAEANQSPVISCNSEDMDKQGLNILSWTDEADVCNIMQNVIKGPPTVSLLYKLLVTINVMQFAGNQSSAKDIAYQMMNIVEARGQEKNDEAINGTFETVSKIFRGTQGQVTQNDIAIFLANAGSISKTLSDEGLINMAAVIWEDKKKNNE